MTEDNEINKQKSHFKKFVFAYALLAVLIIWTLTPFILYCFVNKDYPKLGQIGDMFGTVNSLFSGLTVAGLIFTIIRQQDEMHDSYIKFDQEKKQLQKQIRIQKYQRFDNTFFNLLKLHNSLLISLPEGYTTITQHINSINNNLKNKADYDSLANSYRSIHESVVNDRLGQYFSNFQNTINTIYANKKKSKNRHKYIKTYLCQLKQSELLLIFYHYNLKANEHPENFKDYRNYMYTFITTANPEIGNLLSLIAERRNIRMDYSERI